MPEPNSLFVQPNVDALPPSDSQADRLLRLVHWTSTASRHLRRRLADVAGTFELSDTELLVVWLCSGGGRIQVELASAIGISPAQMSGMVERLRARGLVAMHRLAMDRRRQVWRTTACGQSLLTQAAKHLNELAASVGDGLTEDDQHAAQSLCERLAQAVKQKGLAAAAALLIAISIAPGCSRTFYRRQADIDAYGLVREKATHPHWRLPNYTISVDPRSRMYDPYAIDCPPIPPDDPTSHQLMHCLDNKRAWPFWHDNGDRPFVENQAWPEYIELDDRGVMRLTRDDAVRLALLHSRGYQQQLETLYLSALDVSFERFRFDTQFFAGYQTAGTWTGRLFSGFPGQGRPTSFGGNSDSEFVASTFSNANPQGFRMSKLTTTGGTMLVDFANSLVWNFSGDNDYFGSSLIDFALVQPLLRDAGRERILERLTIAERLLLNNVRAMEQYRQSFYVSTVTGGNPSGGPNRQGGQFGGAGLEGFAGLGGGFGQVGGGQQQQAGGGDAQGAGAAQAGNYLGLLQDVRQIRNQEDNVRRLRRNLVRLTTLLTDQPQPVTGDYLTQDLNVAQSRQALYIAESTLINNRNGFQGNLDNFKTNILALPPQICIEPTDTLLDHFELIQQEIIRLPEDWEALLSNYVDVRRDIPERIQSNVEVVRPAGALPFCRLQRYEGLDDDLARLPPALSDIREFADKIAGEHLKTMEQDIEKFRQAAPRRIARLRQLYARAEELRNAPCELLPLGINPLDTAASYAAAEGLIKRVEAALADVESSYNLLLNHFQGYVGKLDSRLKVLDELQQNRALTPEELFEKLIHGVFDPAYECDKSRTITLDVAEDISRELIELQLLQARARAESIELQEVDLRAEQALEVARRYRRDWMNNRAVLVDRWRGMQFQADQLQGSMSVFFNGSIRNISDNPFRLRADTGTLRAGIQFDAPITRLGERNTYRQAQIEYQQARRNYYNFEDTVAREIRARLRQLTTNEINFELQRLAVLEAARQVILNAFIDQESQRNATTRVTAARDAVQALTDLLNAQNNYMSIWINYEVLRVQLDFALGTMQLDNEGLWIDPGKIGPDYGQYDPWASRGGAGHESGEEHSQDDTLDKTIDQLPPPFMLPQGGREPLPPASLTPTPAGPRVRADR